MSYFYNRVNETEHTQVLKFMLMAKIWGSKEKKNRKKLQKLFVTEVIQHFLKLDMFCYSPVIHIPHVALLQQLKGQFLSAQRDIAQLLQVAADMTISLSSATCRCQTRRCSLVSTALCVV